jgi:hypothetical protein
MNLLNVFGGVANIAIIVFVNTETGKKLIKNNTIRTIVTLGGVAATGYFSYKVIKELAANAKDKQFHSVQIPGNNDYTVPGINDDGTPGDSVDLTTIATNIHDAFYNNDWFGASEDEERAITELTKINANDSPALANLYFTLFGKTLKLDFISYLDDEQITRIQDWLNEM